MITVWFVFYLFVASAQHEGNQSSLNPTNQTGDVTIEATSYTVKVTENPTAHTYSSEPPTSTVRVPKIEEMFTPFRKRNQDVSAPLKRKSQAMCEEYYPHIKGMETIYTVSGGTRSQLMEFPHMAALGFGSKYEKQWLCGGSLISENFVLTAAHCLSKRRLGPVRWVRIGDLDLNNTTDEAEFQEFEVRRGFPHPNHKPLSYYHDIALLKLDKPAELTHHVRPACLHTADTVTNEELIVTGWGTVELQGETQSSHLLKAELSHVAPNECQKQYRPSSTKLTDGIVDAYQICAGGSSGRSTCRGDSGGPLQFKFAEIAFRVVGITSFGVDCGTKKSVGVYTRVSHYLDWIEGIVWPESAAAAPQR